MPMHIEIERTRTLFWDLFQAQRAYLAGKDADYLRSLHHEAEGLKRHEDFSVRTAARVNHAAAQTLLEERGQM